MFLTALDCPATRDVHFSLVADAEPGLLPRLLQPFVRRDLVPDLFSAEASGEQMLVEIGMRAMPDEMMHLVEGNLRQVVGLRSLRRVEMRARQVA